MNVEIRKHLLFTGREIVLRKLADLPITPFPGLEIEFEGPVPVDPAHDTFWEEKVDSVTIGASGKVVVFLEWQDRLGEFDFDVIAGYPGFEILWDSKTQKPLEGH